MDLIKAKSILARLQAMQQALESPAQMSILERDLILHYLRDLYHIYAEAEIQALPTVKPIIPSIPAVEITADKEPVQKTLEFKFEPIEEPIPEPKISKVEQWTPSPPPIHIPEAEPKAPEPKIEVPKFKESVSTTPVPQATKPNMVRASIQELFDVKKGTELTDKLLDLPLKDINRALGINDRLEFIAKLFGGQKAVFEQTILELNNLKSLDEAEELLGHNIALTYKWDHEDQKEKAIDFIKLIRRRYL
jgi:hypothetical protein